MYSDLPSQATGSYVGTQTGVDLTNYNNVYFDVDLGNEQKTYTLNVSDLSDKHFIVITFRCNEWESVLNWFLEFHITSAIGDIRLVTEKSLLDTISEQRSLKIRRVYMK